MPEISRRRNGEIIKEVLGVLRNNPEGLRAKAVIEKVAAELELTPHEKGFYPDGAQRFNKIVRFATIGAVKAGWMIKDKGIWTITEFGRQANEQFRDPEMLYREADRLYREWDKDQPESKAGMILPDKSEKIVEASNIYEEAEENAWNEIQEHIHTMNPYDFQKLVAALLKAMGYHISWIAPRGKDDGIDIIAYSDALGAKDPRIKVQVKHRKDTKVTLDELKSFLAGVASQEVGIYVSSGGYTADAESKARSQEVKKITLVNLQRLFDLWVEHYNQIDEISRYLLPLKPVYFLSPEGIEAS